MTQTGGKRPWLAVLLAFLYPGLGHVYLREWFRAVLWFGLVVSTTTLLIDDKVTAPLDEQVSVDALLTVSQNVPLEASIALFGVTLLSMADAFWMATRQTAETAPENRCPHCGKELDEEIDFCHWCTTELD
jgi:hypothetical protein